MKFPALILALIVAPASHGQENTLYSVDLREVMSSAAQALKQQYPDIAADEVTVANDVYVQCWSTRAAEHVYALDESFKPCEALVVFNLSSKEGEQIHFYEHGRCVRARPPGSVFVYVYEDGRIKTNVPGGSNSAVEIIECTRQEASELAQRQLGASGMGEAFSVDPNAILESAFIAAIDESPATSPEELDFEGMISLFCDVTLPHGGRAGRDVLIKPCVAEATFIDRSAPLEKQFSHTNGRCFVGPKFESVQVSITSDERISARRSEGAWTQVSCMTEKSE